MSTVIGLFEHSHDASGLVDELQKEGFDKNQIGLVTRHEVLKEHGIDATTGSEIGAITGATTGGIAGLLIGLGTLLIPGLNLVAAGTFLVVIGATVLGLAGGAIAGGLVGSLAGLGLSEERANRYSEAVSAGHIIVTVQTPPERELEVSEMMTRYGAVEVDVVPGPTGTLVMPSAAAQQAAMTQPQQTQTPEQPMAH
ncbi:MAG: hypothetical protein ACXWQ5_21340 [Ktedonobacterales bacterium]